MHYVGLDRYLGGYEVTVDLPEAGGLFENSEVTYRGVPVGKVESLAGSTEDGATRRGPDRARSSRRSRPDVRAQVVNRSAIGEQYLDLRGGSTDGEKLGEGAHLTLTAADLPPSIDGLLRSSQDMVASVPSDDLNTVIDEAYARSPSGNGAQPGAAAGDVDGVRPDRRPQLPGDGQPDRQLRQGAGHPGGHGRRASRASAAT